jgi:hypothetical protein
MMHDSYSYSLLSMSFLFYEYVHISSFIVIKQQAWLLIPNYKVEWLMHF